MFGSVVSLIKVPDSVVRDETSGTEGFLIVCWFRLVLNYKDVALLDTEELDCRERITYLCVNVRVKF